MSVNKRTVQKFLDAFAKSNHADVLSCLTDDAEWVVPRVFHRTEKDAFVTDIDNEEFVGSLTITVTRITEEGSGS
jgi:hypothetical protein